MWAVAAIIAGIIGLAAISHRLLCPYLTSSKSQTHKPQSQDKSQDKAECTVVQASMSNYNAFDALQWRKPILGNVMEVLADPNTHLLGVYSSHDEIKDTLLQRVIEEFRETNCLAWL